MVIGGYAGKRRDSLRETRGLTERQRAKELETERQREGRIGATEERLGRAERELTAKEKDWRQTEEKHELETRERLVRHTEGKTSEEKQLPLYGSLLRCAPCVWLGSSLLDPSLGTQSGWI